MIPEAFRAMTRLPGGNRNIHRSLATMTTPRQLFYLSAVVSVFTWVSNPGMAATLRVPGDHATIGAAIAAAAATGDIVEITDSATYVEDLDVQKVITLRGAAGQSPIIRAANTAERFTHLGIAGADRLGALLRAPGIVVENVAFENLDAEVNTEGISSALAILAPNCVVRSCRVTSVPESGEDTVGAVVADLDLPVGGATPTGVLIENCLFVTNTYGFAVSWFVAPQNPPQVTFRGCTFTGNSNAGLTLDSGDAVIENCRFEDNPGDALNVGGGHAEVTDSIFTRNASAAPAAIVLSLDGRSFNSSAVPPGSIRLNRCRIYENGAAGVPAVGVREGTLFADYSIFALNNGPHIRLDNVGREVAPGKVYISHCDFYKSVGSHELLIEGGGTQEVLFDMKNSIVTEADGGFFVIRTELDLPPDIERQNANFCAFYEQAIPLIEIGGANNLLFDSGEPAYNSTDPTRADAFTLPANSPLLTAGEAGTFMGSRGSAVEPQPVTLTIGIDQGLPTLSWMSQSGVTYDVRERTSLTDAGWTIVGSVTGDGAEKSWAPAGAPTANTYWQLLAR
jgi:hypothetical protein